MSFILDSLIGGVTVADDGDELDRRKVLNIIGADVADNPAANRVDVTIPTAIGAGAGVVDLNALRAIDSGAREDRQLRSVASGADSRPDVFVFVSSAGAGVADDGRDIIKPSDVLLASAGRWYRAPQRATTSADGQMSATDKGRADRLNANVLAAEVALDDTNNAIAVAGGHRYHLALGTLTASRRRVLSTTGAVQGDRISIRSENASRYNLHLKRADGVQIASLIGPSSVDLEYDGSAWFVRDPNKTGVFNVRDFGARGDDDESNASNERIAIQAAFDAAKDAVLGGDQRGAAVYFPRGNYWVDQSIVVPRGGGFGRIHVYGDGQDASFLGRAAAGTLRITTVDCAFLDTTITDPTGTIQRATGSFEADGWRPGDQVIVSNTILNNTGRVTLPNTSRDPLLVTGVSGDTLTVAGDVVNEDTADSGHSTGSGGRPSIQRNATVLTPDPDLLNGLQGVWLIEHMTFGTDHSSVLWYDFGDDTDIVNSTYRPVVTMRDVLLRLTTDGAHVPALFFQFGQRCTFESVRWTGVAYGCGIEYRAGSFLTCIDCGVEGVPGPGVYCTKGTLLGVPIGGGNHVFVQSRSDGAYLAPEVFIHGQNVVMMIGYSTEPKQANKALYFKDSKHITILGGSIGAAVSTRETKRPTRLTFTASDDSINRTVGSFVTDGWLTGMTCTIAGTSSNNGSHVVSGVTATKLSLTASLTDETAQNADLTADRAEDGLVLENVDYLRAVGLDISGPFFQGGDGRARAVRIDSACSNIDIEAGYLGHSDIRSDLDIDPAAVSITVRAGTSNGAQPVGVTEVDKLRVWHDFAHVGYRSVFLGETNGNFVGMICRRTGSDPVALVFDEAHGAFRIGSMPDEATYSADVPVYALRYRGGGSGSGVASQDVVLQAGQSKSIILAQSTAANDSTETTVGTFVPNVAGTTLAFTLPSGWSYQPNSASGFWESTFTYYNFQYSGSGYGCRFINFTTGVLHFEVLPDGCSVGAGDLAGAVVALAIKNRTTAPTGNPSNGGVVYEDEGTLLHRGSGGTITQIAPTGTSAVSLPRSVPGTVTTTDATETTLATYTIAASTVVEIDVTVTGYRTGGASGVGAVGDIVAERRRIVAKRVAGGAVIVGTPDAIGTDQFDDVLLLGVTTIDASGNDVRVRVTGKTDATVQWNAEVRTFNAKAV
jgi:pectate lyase-like protein